MPEGDAVWRTARRLHQALAGSLITTWELRWPTCAGVDARGATTREVVPRGKHILHRLDDGRTLHSHLRMDGSWRVQESPPGRAQRAKHTLRAIVGSASATALGWQLGMLDVLPTDREDLVVGHLGPDLLGDDWDAEEARHRLTAQPDREVGAALLDQRTLAGLGTMWTAELLWLARVSPWSRVGDLAASEHAALLDRAHTLLTGTLRFSRSVSTGDWRRPLYLYGQPGRPCRRCATPIAAAPIGEDANRRTLFHCPTCQPRPT